KAPHSHVDNMTNWKVTVRDSRCCTFSPVSMQAITQTQDSTLEAATRQFGEQVLARAHQRRPTAFNERWWDERILEWAMEDEALKTQLFRFVDVLPALRTHPQIARHLKSYFADPSLPFPAVAHWGLDFASENRVAARAVAT